MRKDELLLKIGARKAVVGVVGLGYVGLPLVAAFGEAGFDVVGVDVDGAKIEALNRGQSYVEDVPAAAVARLLDSGRFHAATSYDALAQVDAISICVPTPLRKTKDPDISYIIAAADEISRIGGTGKLIVLESTTYPGTTEEIIAPRLCSNGDIIGKDVFIAFSPERIDPGRTDYTIANTPKVIGGMTPGCLEVAMTLYGMIVNEPIPVSSPAAAEMIKLLENTFRAVNIGLVNEMALMCEQLELDVWEVVAAAATKPYGFMKFSPGPGVGGHCIPLDPHYLSWKLKTLNYTARFINLAAEVNSHMPNYVVSKVANALNGNRKALNGSRILILGVTYKPNVSDVRESPALDVMHLLQTQGAELSYYDPYVPDLQQEGFNLQSLQLTPTLLARADCVVIITDHAAIDWGCVATHARLIVDTRNVLTGLGVNGHIVKL